MKLLLLLLCWTAARAERAEQRGESFWRETCRVWSAEEVRGSPSRPAELCCCQVYHSGDRVQHAGLYYEAKWWSKATTPGSGWGSWQLVGETCRPGQTEESNLVEEEAGEHESPNGIPSRVEVFNVRLALGKLTVGAG